jgi:hypothetical protein
MNQRCWLKLVFRQHFGHPHIVEFVVSSYGESQNKCDVSALKILKTHFYFKKGYYCIYCKLPAHSECLASAPDCSSTLKHTNELRPNVDMIRKSTSSLSNMGTVNLAYFDYQWEGQTGSSLIVFPFFVFHFNLNSSSKSNECKAFS